MLHDPSFRKPLPTTCPQLTYVIGISTNAQQYARERENEVFEDVFRKVSWKKKEWKIHGLCNWKIPESQELQVLWNLCSNDVRI